MRRGAHHRRASRPAALSGNRARAALIQLLYGCTAERLQSFTADELAATHNIKPAKAQEMLAAARERRA